MIIENTMTRLKTFPIGKIKGATRSTLILAPGYNEVNDELWKNVKKAFSVNLEAAFAAGKLKEVVVEKAMQGGKTKKEPKAFTELDATEARQIVADTWTRETLETWREKEERADIRNAIDDRIKEINDRKFDNEIG